MTMALEPKGRSEKSHMTATEMHGVIANLRRRGADAFAKQGWPTTKMEEWRDTNLSAIATGKFAPATSDGGAAAVELAKRYAFGAEAAVELVFINGRFDKALSNLGQLGNAGEVLALNAALEKHPALLEKHLGAYADVNLHPLAALSTSHVTDGAVVVINKGATVAKPIHLLFLSVAEDTTATAPRVLVIAGENSESSVVETYAGVDGKRYHTNAVTEIYAEKHARIDHNKLQQEGNAAYHTALMQVNLSEHATFISHSTSIGSKLTRNDLAVFFGGEYAEATLNGLVLAGGDQHIDNHTLLHHEKANCPSHELYKHVLDGNSTAVFKGKIFVQKDAQKTDSKQTSKSLLLTDTAYMNSQPALEIYADDVKCTHGSTTGPIDENAVFYLVSRGVSLAQARHLMTYAFAADITRRIKVAPVRARIEDFMAAQHGLPQDLRITEEARYDVKLL